MYYMVRELKSWEPTLLDNNLKQLLLDLDKIIIQLQNIYSFEFHEKN